MIWKFNTVYNADRQYSEHLNEAKYLLPPQAELVPGQAGGPPLPPDRKELFIHVPLRQQA
jgi:hypothetical protein